jgi:hypothetical protein
MLKLTRERALKERRERKQEKKEARRLAAAAARDGEVAGEQPVDEGEVEEQDVDEESLP